MATLKELMGDLTKGDGRKFTKKNEWGHGCWFEPIFKDDDNLWSGLDQNKFHEKFLDFLDDNWEPWAPMSTEMPKVKRKKDSIEMIYREAHDGKIKRTKFFIEDYKFDNESSELAIIERFLQEVYYDETICLEVDESSREKKSQEK